MSLPLRWRPGADFKVSPLFYNWSSQKQAPPCFQVSWPSRWLLFCINIYFLTYSAMGVNAREPKSSTNAPVFRSCLSTNALPLELCRNQDRCSDSWKNEAIFIALASANSASISTVSRAGPGLSSLNANSVRFSAHCAVSPPSAPSLDVAVTRTSVAMFICLLKSEVNTISETLELQIPLPHKARRTNQSIPIS